jgi:hypothetical protein
VVFEAGTSKPTETAIAQAVEENLLKQLQSVEGVELAAEQSGLLPGSRVGLSGSLVVEADTAHVIVHLFDLTRGVHSSTMAFDINIGSAPSSKAGTAYRIADKLKVTPTPRMFTNSVQQG